MVPQGEVAGRLSGFIVTWDVNSHDAALCRRLQRFIYGFSVVRNGREYRYPGFVEQEGVRYFGQSVLLVRDDKVAGLTGGLRRVGVEFDLDRCSIG